ncbi:SDR family NAD(P)-dependent oxidoreductase [Kutzneria sp. CA-103260]|uniref:SDR family NAD(P)-dependent oxidoreductase n=1 Tax=Kutzneria sp. CA-103260 TaxID=2802641 RepID=UPI001BABAA81|nr:SDR family oxidoreductase [Kutzneria sp. CA-103260]QUQ62849.1 SDR family oxidoreductase [Kutzneria sp. CA-103260]
MPVAIITGASRGLGLALAHGLSDAGWSLVLDARGAEDLRTAADQLDGPVRAIPGDITDAGHRAELVAAAEELGGLDLLVNNAGVLGPSPLPPLSDFPLDRLREVYEVNVLAQLALTQQALPTLLARDGAVVLVTSDAAVEPYPGWGGYGSAKAALEQIGKVLAVEAPALRVWVVDPGDLRTQMHQDAFPGEDISDRQLPEAVVPAYVKLLTERPESGRVRL